MHSYVLLAPQRSWTLSGECCMSWDALSKAAGQSHKAISILSLLMHMHA